MRSIRNQNIGYLYILPWVVGFLAFQIYPFFMSFYYSFTNFTLVRDPVLIGFNNYIEMFTNDRVYFHSARVTLIYVFVGVPMKLAFALFVAVLMNMKFRMINLFRTLYYLPSILGGSVTIALLWRFLFSRSGVVNQILDTFSITRVDWLGSDRWALFTVILLTVWQFGSSMVIFLAGLKQVPTELYEAATVDGSGKLHSFVKITLPYLTPMILFNLIMQTIVAMQQFSSVFNITGGGPLRATYLYGIMLYEAGFRFLRMGYASAMTWVLFAIIMLFTVMIFKSSSFWVYYEDGTKK